MECTFTAEERLYAVRENLLVERRITGDPLQRQMIRQVGGLLRRVYFEPDNGQLFRKACQEIGAIERLRPRELLRTAARTLACTMLSRAHRRLQELPLFDQDEVPHICLDLVDRLNRELGIVTETIQKGSQDGKSRLPGYIWKMKIFIPEVAKEVRFIGMIFRAVEESGLAKIATRSNGNGAGSSLNRTVRNGSHRHGRTVHGA